MMPDESNTRFRRRGVFCWSLLVYALFICLTGCGPPDRATVADAGREVEHSPLGPLQLSYSKLTQRMETHDEASQRKVDQLMVGKLVPLIDFGHRLESNAIREGHSITIEQSSVDYFSSRKAWEDSLPTHAQRLWPSAWKPGEPGGVFAFRLLLKLPADHRKSATLPAALAFLLDEIQSHCDACTRPTGRDESVSLEPRLSHGTIAARGLNDGSEYAIFEMRWYP